MIQYIKDIRQASGGDLPHSKKDAMIAISNILTSEQSDAPKIKCIRGSQTKNSRRYIIEASGDLYLSVPVIRVF